MRTLKMWPHDWRELFNAYDQVVRAAVRSYRELDAGPHGPAEVKKLTLGYIWLMKNLPIWVVLYTHVFYREPTADALGDLPSELAAALTVDQGRSP